VLEERLGGLLFCLSDFSESGEAFERAAALGDTLEERGVDLSRAAQSLVWGHAYGRSTRLLDEAMALARTDPAPRTKAYAQLVHGFSASILGEFDKAELLAAKGADLGTDDPEVTTLACMLVGLWAEWQGDWRQAVAKESQAMALARSYRIPMMLVVAGWFHGKALCGLGEYSGALASLREAQDVSERIGDRAQRCRLLNTLGWLHGEIGDHETALTFNRRSAEIAQEMVELRLVPSAPEVWANASINQAGDHIARGDLEEAGEMLALIRGRVEADQDPWMLWRYRLHLLDAEARLALARGRPEDALTRVDAELEGARRHQARKLEARAQELRARALLVIDRRPEAEAALREAYTVAESIGYAPVRWRALALESELARRAGDSPRAERQAAATRALTGELAAPLTDERLRRALVSLGERLAADPLGEMR
jgi:tetratricopeptide (TPR) repeat protein